ncbi:AAA family ATPase [Archangium violaceum]|uniref:AAA family ATPase n=1 Tax=Archangium violaceum TaxID=83451 RepID=UPI0037BE5759
MSDTTLEAMPDVLLITGIMAAGKSTVAQALAERLPRSVHVRGDIFRRMIVGGREDMTPEASPEAQRQLTLRYELAATVADEYAKAGFKVVYQDLLLGTHLEKAVNRLRAWRPGVVVLCPSPSVAAARDEARTKTGYGAWSAEAFDRLFRAETPRLGLWVDNSGLTIDETVDFILDRLDQVRNGLPRPAQ